MPRLIRPEAFTFPLFPPSNRYVSEWWPRLPSLGARGRIPPKTGMASSAFILLLAFLLPGATLSALVPIGAILVIWLALSELLFLFANRFGPFTLKRIPWNATLAARRFLPPANASNTPTELPPDLHGIYHMRGNPLPDSLVSFAGAVFKPSSNSFWLRVYDDRSWTWHGNLAGWILYFLVWYTGLEYEIVFDEVGSESAPFKGKLEAHFLLCLASIRRKDTPESYPTSTSRSSLFYQNTCLPLSSDPARTVSRPDFAPG